MITGYVGQPGSGKTLCAVMDILNTERPIYTNIKLKRNKSNVYTLEKQDFIQEVVKSVKRDGTPVMDKQLNTEFWENVEKPCDVVYDEAHSIINSRSSSSKQSKLLMQWVKLIRKMIGGSAGHYGEFLWIAQLPRNIDIDVREMTHLYCYHIMWSTMQCLKCGYSIRKNSEMTSRKFKSCIKCGHYKFNEYDHVIMQWELNGYEAALLFQDLSMRERFKIRHRVITNAKDYFNSYDTLQHEDLHN